MRDCKEKAVEWGVSERSVNDMCKKGKIPGAVKHSGKWCIPDDAIKPVDGRVSSGKYKKKKVNEKRKSLPCCQGLDLECSPGGMMKNTFCKYPV